MADARATPSRADARRNRALVLEAARSAFEEQGLGVPLDEIARRAGVGAGTVYRHFPSKEALFRAAIADRIRLFADTARDLADADDPVEVFFRFLASVVRLASRNKALCDALEGSGAGAGDGTEAGAGGYRLSPGMERDFADALGTLLTRAQEAGGVRPDVSLPDVMALLVGCMAMEQRRSGPRASVGVPGRMTALMCDGLRPERAVTKLVVEAEIRNERVCEECGGPVPPARTGRPARYCGGACRQKAHRARTRGRARTGRRSGQEADGVAQESGRLKPR
ncbi:TetR/AcrR family transcriptional regulator [Streptomyces sp. MST-110588]|uniref:TetR/AcrR family transcriptional regulator n=1 Tax=Streptomyces sp. MST-110588 TaxID=2833628 RepID=UPI001F5C5DCB|nr:TetR/AcrR family transcriptional regulator [Streptomyces sp. MST-110588]UNO40921.1 helix-turn-helix transcriptional regulator [Streptomyces sp. MST-110588]